VNTTRANVRFKTQLTAALAGHLYFATEPYLFEEIMRAVPADLSDFTFVDLGSGKGRVLLMASKYNFRRIVGVEFLRELHESAVENIARYSNANQHCRNIESFCMDARDFEFPAGPLVAYMFNALPEPVFAKVLDNLRRSLQTNLRPVFVCYRYLEFEYLLKECDWLAKVDGTAHWAVFSLSRA
jgi:SAM-dependent methyltransferase